MIKRALFSFSAIALTAMVFTFAGAPTANAALIDVLAESVQGSGTFDVVLGQITSFNDVGDTAAGSYNRTNARYAGDEITPQAGVSQVFFVENSNGLNVFWVHSGSAGGSAGSANTTLSLMDPFNNTGPLGILVEDDTEGADFYTGSGTDTLTASQAWAATFTDGLAAGALNSSIGSGWMLLVNFDSFSGLSSFQATNGAGGNIDLDTYLSSGAAVKFQIGEPSAIPEPGTIVLFGLGLVGLVTLRRKRK